MKIGTKSVFRKRRSKGEGEVRRMKMYCSIYKKPIHGLYIGSYNNRGEVLSDRTIPKMSAMRIY